MSFSFQLKRKHPLKQLTFGNNFNQPLANSFTTIAPQVIDYLGQKDQAKSSALLAEIKAARKPAASLELGIWDELEDTVREELILTFRSRCEECIKNKGGLVRF